MFFFLTRVVKVGEKPAQSMIDMFSDAELTSIMETPARHNELLNVKGIGGSRLGKIIGSWQKYRHIKMLSDFLSPYGLSPGLITRVYNHFEDRAIVIIKGNPYSLTHVNGIGFKKADDVALRLGTDPHDPFRLAACLQFVMASMADDSGNTLVKPEDVISQAAKELDSENGSNIERIELAGELEQMEGREEIVRLGDMLALKRHHATEKRICEALRRRVELPPVPIKSPSETQRFIESIEQKIGITFSEEQVDSIKMVAAGHRTIAVTGYAGTGKSTVSKALIQLLLSKFDEDQVCCMALSGIASDRIRTLSGFNSFTIHSALGWRGQEFEHGPDNQLGYQVIVLDEGSMVNSFIMRNLIEAVDRDAVLILMGDPGQLPPIGAGDPFRNIIESGIIPVARLTRIYRQSDDSVLSFFANDIRRGVVPTGYLQEEGFKDFQFVQKNLPGNYFRLSDKDKVPLREENSQRIIEFIEAKMRAISPYIKNPILDFQLLSPIRKGPLGTEALNDVAQRVFNPGEHEGRAVQVGSVTFKPGDKVVHTLNRDMQIVKAHSLSDYHNNIDSSETKRVFNGSVGVILDGDSDNRELLVAYPEGFIAKYDSLLLSAGVLEMAYALTTHKCQGSEYRFVLIPISSAHTIMLTAQWLYTAVTRAKQKVLMVGQKYMFERACKSLTETRRTTVLEKLISLA
ncbi:ATPase (plasmid) [Pelobacter propionicus DSM 2379]|uniref:ATPase n=2 Tax=Pelobacter propionicus TaxID=29543 RepID=A0R7T4_PELPD|nr:ATPase [Pelobacter propionicus DSM 2379]